MVTRLAADLYIKYILNRNPYMGKEKMMFVDVTVREHTSYYLMKPFYNVSRNVTNDDFFTVFVCIWQKSRKFHVFRKTECPIFIIYFQVSILLRCHKIIKECKLPYFWKKIVLKINGLKWFAINVWNFFYLLFKLQSWFFLFLKQQLDWPHMDFLGIVKLQPLEC